MGQFSWITQDTNESIRNNGSPHKRIAYMHDNNGNVWEENDYEGYGVFGGKDFYILLAEMNGLEVTKDEVEERFAKGFDDTKEESEQDLLRSKAIDLYYSDKPFISPNLTRNERWSWVNRAPQDCPNQGWEDYI
jgi:hypothetical protein